MKKHWTLYNVVWYDGQSAFVDKFILQEDEYACTTAESEELLKKYLDGNGEILKIEPLYDLIFDHIMAMKNAGGDMYAAFERWGEMWF